MSPVLRNARESVALADWRTTATDKTTRSTVLREAFEDAKDLDAKQISQACANHETGYAFYILPQLWMSTFLEYIRDVGHVEPERIRNEDLVLMTAIVIPEDPEWTSSSHNNFQKDHVTTTNQDTIRIPTENDKEDDDRDDDDLMYGITLDRQQQPQPPHAQINGSLQNIPPFQLKPGLVMGRDYVLVGKEVWTLLSSKFGYDRVICFTARFLSNWEKHDLVDMENSSDYVVEIYPPPTYGLSVDSRFISIPSSGYFQYSTTNNVHSSSQLVDNDCGETNDTTDLFPEDSDGKSSLQDDVGHPPLLLLPPSTTATMNYITNHDFLDFNNDTVVNYDHLNAHTSPAHLVVRKRKRYGAGLGNLGNTCFMNSTLQCLAHTWPLRQYFVSGQYKQDLNRDNPLGTGGELATEFANLLQEMWGMSTTGTSTDYNPYHSSSAENRLDLYSYHNNNYRWNPSSALVHSSSSSSFSAPTVIYPRSFKHTLGKHAEQFMGYDQHDSQELATFLLDALHEDTNRVTKKPYIEKPEQGDGEPDDVAAAKSWELHLRRENSRVLEDFMGQVKSRVECPRSGCGRVSTTFDPFMYLSVPIPGVNERKLAVTYVPLNPLKIAKKLQITLNKSSDISQLRQAVSKAVNDLDFDDPVNCDDIVMTEVFNSEVFTWYSNDTEVTKIQDSDSVYAFRLTSFDKIRADMQRNETMQESNSLTLWLDDETLADLNHNDKWRVVLERYARQPLAVTHLLNPRHDLGERLEFLHNLRVFLERCLKTRECTEYRNKTSTSCTDDSYIGSTSTDTVKNDVEDSKIDKAQGENMISTAQAYSDDGLAVSLEERCINSRYFKGIKGPRDVAILEYCSQKVSQSFLDERRAGEVQIVFVRPVTMFSHSFQKGENFSYPLVLRISPTLTVYELRKILAERLSEVFKPEVITDLENVHLDLNHSPDSSEPATSVDNHTSSSCRLSKHLSIMRRITMYYERVNTYSRHLPYRTLGMCLTVEGTHSIPQVVALESDEAEQKQVLDLVGNQGKIILSLPENIYEHMLDVKRMSMVEEVQKMQDDKCQDDKNTTVLHCISKYCQREQLEETEMWYCGRCKEHVPAWKQISLYRLPPILIIHLKRFHFSMTSHRRSKIDTLIDFPLKGLDLRQEVMNWAVGEEPLYDCYAVSNHYQGLGGGHYTAFAQNDDGDWCCFDDSRVTTGLSPESIITPAAYVLYYRRQDVELPNESVGLGNLVSMDVDFDTDRLLNDNVSMLKASPIGSLQGEVSSMGNDITDDRDDSFLNSNSSV